MELEKNLMYHPMQKALPAPRQKVYTIGDLESMSASYLYSGEADGKNFVKKDGTIETVLPKFVGEDTVKIYTNPLTGRVDAGYQKEGESHKEYSNSGRMINLDKGE